jgi:glycosyltransferase involved in cell wall biosynthesis
MRHFDISRLAQRATANGPSGIDRVDLAYLQWLRTLGPVRYLVHGVAGFSKIDHGEGEAFTDALATAWQGRKGGLPPERVRHLRDSSIRLRAAGKWRERRRGLDEITRVENLQDLCRPELLEKLDLLDASAGVGTYRIDPSWRTNSKAGCYFGVSHAMLGRTAFVSALARQSRLKRVFFIHDTIPCDFPEYCRALEGHRHLLRLRNAFRYGTHLVANSDYTANRIEHWRRLLDAPQRPVAVVPIGVDEGLMAHKQPASLTVGDGRPYFVVLGTIEPRKNHLMLLQVWRHFAETLPAGEIPRLLVIGRRGWENEVVFRMLDRCDSLKPHVVEMNAVGDEQLWPLLRGARAMLFPSFVEGWGMPMVEALTLGVPVIASDIPAFREAGVGIPDLLPPLEGGAWGQAVLDYTSPGSEARAAQLALLTRYRPPTWSEHFAKLLDWLGPESLGVGKSHGHERH